MLAPAYMAENGAFKCFHSIGNGSCFSPRVFARATVAFGGAAPRLFRPKYAGANMGHPSRGRAWFWAPAASGAGTAKGEETSALFLVYACGGFGPAGRRAACVQQQYAYAARPFWWMRRPKFGDTNHGFKVMEVCVFRQRIPLFIKFDIFGSFLSFLRIATRRRWADPLFCSCPGRCPLGPGCGE
jgi:hypothetical protein